MIKVNCINCNKDIFKYPYEIKNSKKGVFVCSKKCYSSYSSKVKVNCNYCNKEIKLWPHIYNNSKYKTFFCSKKCHYSFGNPTTKGVPRSEDIKSKISIKNKGNIMPEHQRQQISNRIKKARNWKGGITPGKYSKEYREIRTCIRKRDNYQCQICFIYQFQLKQKLSVHHINYNKNNNDPDNLISLCRSCHAKIHYEKNDWEIYLKNKIRGNNYADI